MPCGKENEARAFYSELLGMKEIPKPPELQARGGAWFESGAVRLHIGAEENFRPARKAHPALACTSYDALVARLEERGVPVTPNENLDNEREHCYISDPFGNRIELISGP